LDPQVTGTDDFGVEHWLPSKTVLAGHAWHLSFILWNPSEQTQEAPFQEELSPHDEANGSQLLEMWLNWYPLAQLSSPEGATQSTPFHWVPSWHGAQAERLLWKNPALQVHETPLK